MVFSLGFQKACKIYFQMLFRVLISVIIGFVLVMLYLIAAHYLFIYYFQHPMENGHIPNIYIGLELPTLISKDILPILRFWINVLIYSIPPYILLSLISRFRKSKRQPTGEPPPPPPPSFDS